MENKEEKNSPAIEVISNALEKTDEVLQKSIQSLNLLQQNLQQVTSQRIGLEAQKAMLVELKARVDAEEKRKSKNEH